jgi:hypothetical protein
MKVRASFNNDSSGLVTGFTVKPTVLTADTTEVIISFEGTSV